MIRIYHNPRCRKSREGLAVLEDSGVDYQVVNYLEDRLDENALREILKYLGIDPLQLIRTNEKIWKEEFKGRELSDEELIRAMVKYPKLIERPIVVKNNSAVIGRPSDTIKGLLSS